MIKIAIVDDKAQQRESLSKSLILSGEIEVLFSSRNGAEFLESLQGNEKKLPDVVLMDIDMPVMNGIKAVEVAKVIYPQIHFLMFTVFDDDERIFDAIRAGAGGYLLKDEKTELVKQAIVQLVETGGVPMSPMIARKAMNLLMNSAKPAKTESDDHNLSSREFEILKLVVEGYDSAEIGEKLFISPLTVRKHIANIYNKLHVSNKTEAVRLAVKKRWFDI